MAPERLNRAVAQVLEDKQNELYISPITVWEILVLAEKGRIELRPSPSEWISEALKRSPVKEAPLSHTIAIKSRSIEVSHQDPADRFIAATAWENDFILITADGKLQDATQIKVFQVA